MSEAILKNNSQPHHRKLIAVLVPGLIAFSMGQTVLFALAGPVFRDIGLSESQLGIVVSAAAVVFMLASGAWGRISDRWGRRPTIVFGLVTYGIITIAFAGVMHAGLQGALAAGAVFIGLLILRLLYAGLGAGIQPASVALMADVSSTEDRSSAVAVIGAAFGIGMVLGPASAAALVGFGVLTPLYVIAILGLLGALLAAIGLPRTTQPVTAAAADQGGVALRVFVLLFLGALFVYTTMAVVQQTMAFNLQDLLGTDSAETARLTGFCFMAIAIAMLVVQGGVIQALKPKPILLLLVGPPVILAGLLTYTAAETFVGLLVAATIIGTGFGFATPGLQSAASVMAGANHQGKIAGLMQATMSAGFIVGPLAGTYVYEIDRLYTGQLGVAATIAATVVIYLWIFLHRTELSTD